MKSHPYRLSPVYSLLILIPLVAACQSEREPTFALPEEEIKNAVQQAGSNDDHSDDRDPLEDQVLEPDYNHNIPDDQSVPSLMGFAVRDPMHKVSELYGKAEQQYMMEDDAEMLVVHNYKGFSVGFNERKTVHFIDVYAPEVDPGLDGLRIGSVVDQALQTLGEPMQQTNSVLMYAYGDIVLKLDVDHSTGEIVSFKMFEAPGQ